MKKNTKTITIVRPKSLAAIVADRLRDAILKTELSLGEMLSEEKIANAMNVSRTPVREALTMLQLQGLINIIPQRGSFVFKPDAADLEALVQYRLMLETQAAQLAMKANPVKAAAALGRVVAAMERASENDDAAAYTEADSSFHNVFFEFCGNHYLSQAYEIAGSRIAALRAHLSQPLGMHRGRTLREHIEIAQAFERGDARTALGILEVHIANMRENYGKALIALGLDEDEPSPARGRRADRGRQR